MEVEAEWKVATKERQQNMKQGNKNNALGGRDGCFFDEILFTPKVLRKKTLGVYFFCARFMQFMSQDKGEHTLH